MERRMTPAGEIKVENRADGGKMIVGYGAVFYRAGSPGTEYELWRDFKEHISPTAFDRALKEKHDARGLFNHDPNMLLGRVSSGTMRLGVDDKGMRYEIDIPDSQPGVTVTTAIARKDLTGSSFSFRVTKETWEDRDGLTIRTIEDVDLFDTGPVTFPAYEATTTGLRSGDAADAIAARDKWRKDVEAEKVKVRSRLISLDNDLQVV